MTTHLDVNHTTFAFIFAWFAHLYLFFPHPIMEPVFLGGTSPPEHRHEKHHCMRDESTQAFAERVVRALRHRLLLLYRSDPNFYVLGATGNVYVVNISSILTCTCPDRSTPCKHILFVLIKVLGLPLDDPCLRKHTLRPSQVARLLANPSSIHSLAKSSLRERFHQLFLLQKELGGVGHILRTEIDQEGAKCPICLEEMGKSGDRLVACGACRNPLHEECLMSWKRASRRRFLNCVICRAKWGDGGDQEKYLNLATYDTEDNVSPDRDNLCGG